MIDTVKIVVNRFSIKDYRIFEDYKGVVPSTETIEGNFYLKPFEYYGYIPKVNLVYNYYAKRQLYIEFSASKLLFDNNLTELNENHFQNIVTKLFDFLERVGILISRETIEAAIVKRIDYSKNIILPENISCADVINILKTAEYPHMELKEMEPNKWIRFSSNDLAISFYDKVEELKHHGYFDGLSRNVRALPEIRQHRILRMEIQMKEYSIKNYILDDILDKTGKAKFEQLFSEQVFKEIFRKVLKKLNETIPSMILEGQEVEDLKEICETSGEIAKKFLLLHYQKQQGNYFDGIKKLREDYDIKNNFIEANNCLLIKNEYFKNILMKYTEQIRNYKPLNYQLEY
jgi:hypothetical protein